MARIKTERKLKTAARFAEAGDLEGVVGVILSAEAEGDPDLHELLAQGFTQSPLLEALPQVRARAAELAGAGHVGAMLAAIAPHASAIADLRIRLENGAIDGEIAADLEPVLGRLERARTGVDPLDARLNAELWLRLAQDLMQHGAVRSESVVLERWTSLGDAEGVQRSRLARLLLRQGRPDAAAAQLQALAAAGDEESLRRLAGLLEDHPDAAGAHFAPALPERPGGALPRCTLVFPHARKTGGNSLHNGLKAILGEGCLGTRQISLLCRRLRAMTFDERSRLDLVTGHFGFEEAQNDLAPLLAKPALYLGVIRDPVDRAKSVYNFMGKSGSDLKRRQSLRVDTDPDLNVVVERWLSAPTDWGGWRNEQCRIICGEPDAAQAIHAIETRYLAAVATPAIDALVGAMANGLDRAVPPPMHVKRSNSHRLELDPRLAERLRSYHEQDQRLFDWVRDNQDRMLSRVAETIERVRA